MARDEFAFAATILVVALACALFLLSACSVVPNHGINTTFQAEMPIEGTLHFQQ